MIYKIFIVLNKLIKYLINKLNSSKYYFFIITFLLIIGGNITIEPTKKKIDPKYIQICQNIAKDIELLKKKYPQLKEFEIPKNLNEVRCIIQYEYKCHESTSRAGWVSLVPKPDPTGVWFYICLWDKNDPEESSSQINTQAVRPLMTIKNRYVTYLILEGKKTKSINDEIYGILKKYGLKESK